MKNPKLIFNKHSSTILAILASFGAGGSVVSAIAATPKALKKIERDSRANHNGDPYAYTKKEAVASAWKFYIPTAALTVSTIVCILGSNALNKHQQAMLTSAYALLNSSYKDYKNKLKELYGEEAHNNIVNELAKETVDAPHLYTCGAFSSSTLDFGESVEPEVIRTFYDEFSDRYFETTTEKVLQAEFHLNRNYWMGGAVSVNQFYKFLGIKGIEGGDSVGWDTLADDGWCIDFNHQRITLDDGMEINIIEMVSEPTADFLEDY